MAKAKKSTSESAAPEAKPKKAAMKKAVAKAPTAPAGMPLIDTNLAASTAARAVAHKDEIAAATAGPRGSGESAAFKQLKENLHKSGGQNTPSFLQSIAPAKKFNPSVPGRNQQVGRNQTFGADVNRTGVPRRTSG